MSPTNKRELLQKRIKDLEDQLFVSLDLAIRLRLDLTELIPSEDGNRELAHVLQIQRFLKKSRESHL